MKPIDAIKSVFNNYANFNGRARRSEYWWFVLFTFICSSVLNLITPILSSIFSLAILVPSIAVLVRRFHDIGKSGWHSLVAYLIPFISLSFIAWTLLDAGNRNSSSITTNLFFIFEGLILFVLIWYIILLAKDSQPGDNEYGPNPKEEISSEILNSIGNN